MLETTLRVCLPSWTLQIPGPQDVSRSALRQWTLRQEPSTSVSAFPLSSCVLLNLSESSSPNMDESIYITGPLGRVNEIVNSWMLCKIQEFYRNWGCIILFISNRFSHRFPSDALLRMGTFTENQRLGQRDGASASVVGRTLGQMSGHSLSTSSALISGVALSSSC